MPWPCRSGNTAKGAIPGNATPSSRPIDASTCPTISLPATATRSHATIDGPSDQTDSTISTSSHPSIPSAEKALRTVPRMAARSPSLAGRMCTSVSIHRFWSVHHCRSMHHRSGDLGAGASVLGKTSLVAARAHRCEATESMENVGRSGHASAFEVTIADGDDRSPEQWARAVFEEAPTPIRWFVQFGWCYVLGLRLGPPSSPDHVAGWAVRDTGPSIIDLEVQSWLLTATKEIRVGGDTVRIETDVHFRRNSGRVLWTLLTPVHYLTEPYLLGFAASHPG
jgi:hypothetical protein